MFSRAHLPSLRATLKVLWLSSNRFGHALLHEALKLPCISIEAVLTLSEDASTKMYDAVPQSAWAELGLRVLNVRHIEDVARQLWQYAPDLIVMAGWRQVIPRDVISIPKFGIIGFHPTLLPIGRGPAPIINSILGGFTRSGVTMFYVSDAVDAGDIVGQESFSIDDHDYAGDVYEKVISAGRTLVRTFIPQLALGTAPRIPQDDSRATYFEKRTLKDNEIRPDDPVEVQRRKVRAFAKPYLGAYRLDADGNKHVIWRIEDLGST